MLGSKREKEAEDKLLMITVIVPYKDSAKWLPRCLESLRSQKGDFEFLLINDGSVDEGPKIALEFACMDDRFRIFDNKRGQGVSGARNMGIDYASGEWITFLDADDEMLENAEAAFESAMLTDADVHQFNHQRYYRNADAYVHKYLNEGGFYDIRNLPAGWFGVWNKLFRSSFIEDIRFDETLQYGEDGLFVLECLAKKNSLHHADSNVFTVRHRIENRGSLSHRKTARDVVKQIQRYEEFLLRQDDKIFWIMLCREFRKLWERVEGLVE